MQKQGIKERMKENGWKLAENEEDKMTKSQEKLAKKK